jgi:hypothetical protein
MADSLEVYRQKKNARSRRLYAEKKAQIDAKHKEYDLYLEKQWT